jgi:chaperonin cofactor prefoldin
MMLWFYTKKQVARKMVEMIGDQEARVAKRISELEARVSKMFESQHRYMSEIGSQVKVLTDSEKQLSSKCEILKEHVVFLKGQMTGKGKT